jgi:heat shock protein HslJ
MLAKGRSMNTRSIRALALAAGAFLAGCTAMSGSEAPALDGTAWVLSSLGGRAPAANTSVTLRFDGGRALGTDGCNRYTAPFTAAGGALEIGPRGASTQIACPPPVSDQAQAFMAALTGAKRYRVAGGNLELLGANGGVLAVLAAQSRTLAGTTWEVTGYNNGRQAVVSVLGGTRLTMAFSDDRRVAGTAGCNRYNAAYALDGERLTLGMPAATRMMCAKPEGVMEQEQQFLKAFAMVATARFEGDRLELRSPDGALAMTLKRGSGE